ncbi:hypothetical protein [Corynebacterium epidermidicanis]|nr:hypothetical protein [Corynebacterium epidermidicanis]
MQKSISLRVLVAKLAAKQLVAVPATLVARVAKATYPTGGYGLTPPHGE